MLKSCWGIVYLGDFLYLGIVQKKLNKYIIMEANVNKLVNVDVFKHKDEVKLSGMVNEFLGDAGDSISFINSSITYNTDTEEYVALISFYLLDEMKFIERVF